MQAEQNELITRVGPGTACGALLRQLLAAGRAARRVRSAARPAHGAAAGQGGARARPGPRAVPRRRRPLRPARSRLPAPRRRPVVRPARRRRPALPVPRLEVRRRRRLPRDAGRAGRQQAVPARAPAQLSGAGASGVLFAWLGAEGATPPALAGVRLLRRARRHSFAFKGLWHCNWLQAFEVGIDPAHPSFLHRYLHDGSLDAIGEAYGRTVSRRQRRRRRRRALADDADHARVPPARDPLRAPSPRPAA